LVKLPVSAMAIKLRSWSTSSSVVMAEIPEKAAVLPAGSYHPG
jgi:hypothetical protein